VFVVVGCSILKTRSKDETKAGLSVLGARVESINRNERVRRKVLLCSNEDQQNATSSAWGGLAPMATKCNLCVNKKRASERGGSEIPRQGRLSKVKRKGCCRGGDGEIYR
jgi:hypothetical protein